MEFLRRALRLAAWSSLMLVPGVAIVFGWHAAVGVASGLLWALANMWVMGRLVKTSFSAQRLRGWESVSLWILKLPFLYAVGAVLLLSPWGSPLGFLVGFSLWFVCLFVSALRGAAV
jgi:hypothetical protein